jgi:glycosyltransferase involved in cell wall biosynthesis
MKILYLADGAATHTRRWLNWFSSKGHDVELATFNKNILTGYNRVSCHVLWRSHSNSILERFIKAPIIYLKLLFIIFRFKPDVIHSHSAGAYAWITLFIPKIPIVITPWGVDLLEDVYNSYFNYFFTRASLKNADYVTTDGRHFIKLLNGLGVHKKKISVVYFGVDTHYFSPAKNKLKNKSSTKLKIISTRTLYPVHDVLTLINAVSRVYRSNKNFEVLIIGDGSEKPHLENKCIREGLEKICHFYGNVDHSVMLNLLRQSDIYVSTSPLDAGIAASTAEAMSVGLPIIHTNFGDNNFWTPNKIGGLLFTPGSDKELAKNILELLKNKKLRDKLSKFSRDKIIKNYNIDIEMKKVEKIYSSLAVNLNSEFHP